MISDHGTSTYHASSATSTNFTPYHDLGNAQCLKITENVSFNIASEASYVYILNAQKFLKNAKNGQNLMLAVKQCYQTGQF